MFRSHLWQRESPRILLEQAAGRRCQQDLRSRFPGHGTREIAFHALRKAPRAEGGISRLFPILPRVYERLSLGSTRTFGPRCPPSSSGRGRAPGDRVVPPNPAQHQPGDTASPEDVTGPGCVLAGVGTNAGGPRWRSGMVWRGILGQQHPWNSPKGDAGGSQGPCARCSPGLRLRHPRRRRLSLPRLALEGGRSLTLLPVSARRAQTSREPKQGTGPCCQTHP